MYKLQGNGECDANLNVCQCFKQYQGDDCSKYTLENKYIVEDCENISGSIEKVCLQTTSREGVYAYSRYTREIQYN